MEDDSEFSFTHQSHSRKLSFQCSASKPSRRGALQTFFALSPPFYLTDYNTSRPPKRLLPKGESHPCPLAPSGFVYNFCRARLLTQQQSEASACHRKATPCLLTSPVVVSTWRPHCGAPAAGAIEFHLPLIGSGVSYSSRLDITGRLIRNQVDGH